MPNQWIQCPNCSNQFEPWRFPNQKFPFKSCIDCRKSKASGQNSNEDFALIQDRLGKMGSYLEERFSEIERKLDIIQGLREMNQEYEDKIKE